MVVHERFHLSPTPALFRATDDVSAPRSCMRARRPCSRRRERRLPCGESLNVLDWALPRLAFEPNFSQGGFDQWRRKSERRPARVPGAGADGGSSRGAPRPRVKLANCRSTSAPALRSTCGASGVQRGPPPAASTLATAGLMPRCFSSGRVACRNEHPLSRGRPSADKKTSIGRRPPLPPGVARDE
jgi:hypothetical protein